MLVLHLLHLQIRRGGMMQGSAAKVQLNVVDPGNQSNAWKTDLGYRFEGRADAVDAPYRNKPQARRQCHEDSRRASDLFTDGHVPLIGEFTLGMLNIGRAHCGVR